MFLFLSYHGCFKKEIEYSSFFFSKKRKKRPLPPKQRSLKLVINTHNLTDDYYISQTRCLKAQIQLGINTRSAPVHASTSA